MKTYTIEAGQVSQGIKIERRTLSCGVEINVVVVGERGRGRKEAFIPVECSNEEVLYCTLGKTMKGGHKIIETNETDETDERCLIAFRTPIGFRGGNSHTGDRIPNSDPIEFLPFPGEILAEGTIAQGGAGRMGAGKQLIAIVPKQVVFRTGYSGRLYGKPSAHYYTFTGKEILCATWEERVASELF